MEITSEVENSKLPQFSKQQLDDLLRTIYQLHSPPQGGKRRLKPPRRVECGERLFGNVDPKKVVDLFIAALEHVPTFEEEFKLANHKLDFDAGILHILVQSFFIWMEMYESKWRKQKKPPATPTSKSSKSRTLISTKNATVEEDFRIPQDQRTPSPPANRLSNKLKNMAQIGGEQNANNNGPSTSTPSPAQGQQKQRILIHPNHRNRLLDLLIPIDFTGKGPYIWKAIFNILELKNQKYLVTFIARVLDFVEKGKVSFTVLHYCLSHSNISGRMAIPKLLPTALLLGSLDAQTVEQFVANRTEQFRAECRRLLLQAESWKLDEKKFQDAVQEFTHRSHLQVPSHAQFNTTLTSLLSELRKEVCVNQTNLVNDYWAISLIRSAANKYYKEKSWSADQFNDLIHTLLVQRPAQKSFLLNVLLKDHNDKQAWERWRNFVSSDRIHMSKNFQKMSLYSKEDNPEFLSLPRKCDVFFIGNVQQFCIFKKQFEEYEQKKQSTILCGIDAEWNSYVMKSSASLLQISLAHSVYLLDLDALHVHPDFLDFIDRFFMSTEIVKIGYQFSEDLVQMRQRLPNCIGLYRPANIYCIGKIVDELHRRSRTKLGFQLNQFLLPITEQEEEAMKEHTRQVKPGFRGRGGGNNGNNRAEKEKGIPQENGRPEDEFGFNEDEHSPPMAKSSNYKFGEQGLSYLCRSMLGKPLNKLEQCSVWDRRPLRSSQIRYAALDAHCLIRLFQRCKEWCVALDAGDDPLYMVPVSCLHVSLPLFWNKPLPANLPESAIAPWQQQKEEEVKTNDGSWDEDELKNNDGWGWKDVVEENGGQPADGN